MGWKEREAPREQHETRVQGGHNVTLWIGSPGAAAAAATAGAAAAGSRTLWVGGEQEEGKVIQV